MPDNRTVESNGVLSKSSSRSVEEAVQRLKIQTTDDEDSGVVANSFHYPDRPGEPNCMYYMRNGLCGYGSKCRFNHPVYAGQGGQQTQRRGELPERVGQPVCGHYLKTGTCKYGPACKYHHPRDKNGVGPVQLNSLGLPMRQEGNACPHYMRTGSCKFGVACKFHHPQPASAGTFSPVSGPAVYGFPSSSVPTSSGLHFGGGAPTMSLPRVPYLSGPFAQGPQAYIPVVLSPSEGIAAHGWNTYLGEAAFGGLVQSSTIISYLPERPDQPECRRFMSTGSCKYGSDCKYHHPRERIAQWTTNSLGPLGLPSRPGLPVCSYYSFYGLCEYGPTCKYDHPLTGYSYNSDLNFPALPVFYPPVFPYQRNMPTVLSLEQSPPKLASISDWVNKPEAEVNENPKLDTETPENASDHAISPQLPLSDSSELSHEQSD
ncbi:zinc finger CCCH domain-containing protein 58-like isoform X1 [Rhododendron vialii]|uniref:zinc finger CCCH domain-containing protein 58-like isoform X1 n=1 Tax=Rhododendron vialii TaxID=182163 RepID=UPI00265E3A80|nr:zinc finger CCCH domain-containing protein 58-like isoform X1 [Rhododendron vialii]